MAGAVPTAPASTSGGRAGPSAGQAIAPESSLGRQSIVLGPSVRQEARREATAPWDPRRQATAPEEAGSIGEGEQDKGKEVLSEPPHLQCGAVQCDDVQDVDLFEYGETPLSPLGVDRTGASQKESGTGAGKGAGPRRQRARQHAVTVKREGWVHCSDVRVLFQEDPARLGHPLRVETVNKAGICVLKIRCQICQNLFSFHNSSWTCASNHVLSHNLATHEDVHVPGK